MDARIQVPDGRRRRTGRSRRHRIWRAFRLPEPFPAPSHQPPDRVAGLRLPAKRPDPPSATRRGVSAPALRPDLLAPQRPTPGSPPPSRGPPRRSVRRRPPACRQAVALPAPGGEPPARDRPCVRFLTSRQRPPAPLRPACQLRPHLHARAANDPQQTFQQIPPNYYGSRTPGCTRTQVRRLPPSYHALINRTNTWMMASFVPGASSSARQTAPKLPHCRGRPTREPIRVWAWGRRGGAGCGERPTEQGGAVAWAGTAGPACRRPLRELRRFARICFLVVFRPCFARMP